MITTLQMYLRNNQSIKKTAGAMFVHYRTISYRLDKIKQISGINFDNANEVLAVSNGLIIYKMLKEIEQKKKEKSCRGMVSFFIDFENYINVVEHFLQKFFKKISAL